MINYLLYGAPVAALIFAVVYIKATAPKECSREAKTYVFATAAIISLIILTLLVNYITFDGSAFLKAQFSYANIMLLGALVLIFYLMPANYINSVKGFFGLMAIALVLIFIGIAYARLSTSLVAMFGIGTIFGMEPIIAHGAPRSKHNHVEINRDIVQIFMGLLVLFVFLVFDLKAAIAITMSVVFVAYGLNCYVSRQRNGVVFKFLSKIERENDIHLTGALYLAAGFSLIMGFAPNIHVIEFAIIALFFADSLATIAGRSIKSARLFYNKNKSMAGTLAYFITCSALGYLFIGYSAIVIGIIAAAVESMRLLIDDNATAAVAVLICSYVLGL